MLRFLTLALLLVSGAALAQTSQKSIQILVPFAPGASSDGISRRISPSEATTSRSWSNAGSSRRS